MPTVEVEIEVEVWCSCGVGLCNQADGGNGCVTIEPCEHCLATARGEGYDDGHLDGSATGYDEGYDQATGDCDK